MILKIMLFTCLLLVGFLVSFYLHETNATNNEIKQSLTLESKFKAKDKIILVKNDETTSSSVEESSFANRAESARRTIFIGNNRSAGITIVTLMFQFNKSKHSNAQYDHWSNTMMASLSSPFVAYVDNFWSKVFIERCNRYNLTGNKTNFCFFMIKK